jgi:transcriptional regulator with XRE-family HTH domain
MAQDARRWTVAKTDPRVRFGKGVRALRQARGLTQAALADKGHLDSWKYVSTVENARTNITLTNVPKLAEGLGVSPAEMMEACFPASATREDLLARLIELAAKEEDATIDLLLGILDRIKLWQGAPR